MLLKINGAQSPFAPPEIVFSPTPVPSAVPPSIVTPFEKAMQNILIQTQPPPPPPLPIPAAEPADHLASQISYILHEIVTSVFNVPVVTFVAFMAVLAGVGQDDSVVGNPYDDMEGPRYDVVKADLFYGSRPLYVFRRAMRLLFLTAAFNWNLFWDWRNNTLKENEKIRAKEALELCAKLGPTFIKLGQALSIRTDLINEAYAMELQKLQDAVPPFNTTYAKEIICKEIGIKDLKERFKFVSEQPIAAASIGQVYRATLLDGTDVAIKVQRPKILNDIAVDLYLLRLICPFQTRITNFAQGIIADQFDIDSGLALVDEWGRGAVHLSPLPFLLAFLFLFISFSLFNPSLTHIYSLFISQTHSLCLHSLTHIALNSTGLVAEADYRLEATNAKQFIKAMEVRGLTALTAPAVIDTLSGSKVLVTSWMEGTRLDRDASPDVPRYVMRCVTTAGGNVSPFACVGSALSR